VSNRNLDPLLDCLLCFAQETLSKYDEFYPFAASMTGDASIQMEVVYEGDLNERPSAQRVIDLLIEAMRSAVGEGRIVAGGLCTNVRVKQPDGTASTDAVQVHLEQKGGEPLDVFLPYEKISAGEFRYGDLFALKSTERLFWRS